MTEENRAEKRTEAGRRPKAKKKKRPREVERSTQRADMIWAIAHPLRRQVLRTLSDHGEPCSPMQVSQQLGLPVSPVAYHFNILRKYGAVELVDEQMARGAVEHFYDSTIEDDPPIETLLEETRAGDDTEE